ncbi:hypothetical protein [Aquimarina algiphila]|uniref:hypothetical protein n=1 Tax=Aquimarina algiphila TaxID=2047982 RepID=UPI00232D507E|nr:hypothetical protein [Aquimarina algiphila]
MEYFLILGNIPNVMLSKSKPAKIDDVFIEQMIERCYSVDQYVKVSNSGYFYAQLKYGEYTYRNRSGTFTEEKKLRPLKSIFHKLINRHLSFEHEGHSYFYSSGSWRVYRLED